MKYKFIEDLTSDVMFEACSERGRPLSIKRLRHELVKRNAQLRSDLFTALLTPHLKLTVKGVINA